MNMTLFYLLIVTTGEANAQEGSSKEFLILIILVFGEL